MRLSKAITAPHNRFLNLVILDLFLGIEPSFDLCFELILNFLGHFFLPNVWCHLKPHMKRSYFGVNFVLYIYRYIKYIMYIWVGRGG